jgi:hypothetical protein
VTGAASTATGTILSIDTVYKTITLGNVSGTFIILETITSSSGGSQINSFVDTYSTGQAYQHEFGKDQIEGDFQTALESSITTQDFSLVNAGTNYWTRISRIEPDFDQVGDMSVEVIGQEFANSPPDSVNGYPFTGSTEYIDMREQHRHLRLKFISNAVGGSFEMGRIMIHLEQGDLRS